MLFLHQGAFLLQTTVPIWELILRSAVVYVFLLIAIRLTGRRQVGQLSPLDFILLLILSNSVQNSINAGDNSLVGGLISATTLIALHWSLSFITFKSKTAADLLDGTPEILVHNGKIMQQTLDEEQITRDDLDAMLRKNGVEKLEEVRYLVLEANGAINLIKKNPTKE